MVLLQCLHSIMNLDKETGISIMKIGEELDTGPVCNVYKINIENNLNAEDVDNIRKKLDLLEAKFQRIKSK